MPQWLPHTNASRGFHTIAAVGFIDRGKLVAAPARHVTLDQRLAAMAEPRRP
jgi:hypothetical protein